MPPTPTPPITTTSTSDEDRSSEDLSDDGGMSGDEDEDGGEEELGYETYTFLGCFADNERNRVLDYNFEDPEDMTVQVRGSDRGGPGAARTRRYLIHPAGVGVRRMRRRADEGYARRGTHPAVCPCPACAPHNS